MTVHMPRPFIVAGADGSPPSIKAIRWAAEQARLTGSDLRIVTGWEVRPTIYIVPTYTEADYERDARKLLDQTVADALGPNPGEHVEKHLYEGKPARALVVAADQAELLVIGSHGHGEFPGMHLGSVASYCVHHAPCPVVVVRDRTTGR
jgi:nucleotide-binding universal stress UspA family protein